MLAVQRPRCLQLLGLFAVVADKVALSADVAAEIPGMSGRTWNDCQCKWKWTDTTAGTGKQCAGSCCNPDEDTNGAWCLVEKIECESDIDWGYCKPAEAPALPDISGCQDISGWKDSDGDGCPAYAKNNWCTATGLPGLGWHEEWGEFPESADGRVSADQACCVCGGGNWYQTQHNDPAARVTWNGCRCRNSWKDSESCTGYCCNPDLDEMGDWCMVVDPLCEESTWGYCRPPPDRQRSETCMNDQHWRDTSGQGCDVYKEWKWCTETGGEGPGWNKDWGVIASYGKDGQSALTACCSCGGGSTRAPGGIACEDEKDWEDTDGSDCSDYTGLSWCTASGGEGVGWHHDWGVFKDYVKTTPASKGCCGCGGGSLSVLTAAGRLAEEHLATTGRKVTFGGVLLAWFSCSGIVCFYCCFRKEINTEAAKVAEVAKEVAQDVKDVATTMGKPDTAYKGVVNDDL